MSAAAFSLGQKELLAWVNNLLQLNIKKVEEMANGAYHCQILDVIYPGKVPLHKVNFNAKHDYEFMKNFQILQAAFSQQGVDKFVDVPKLIKAKFQDNLEFFQWMKLFFDKHYTGNAYNPIERREQAGVRISGQSATEVKQPAKVSKQPQPTVVAKSKPKPQPIQPVIITHGTPQPSQPQQQQQQQQLPAQLQQSKPQAQAKPVSQSQQHQQSADELLRELHEKDEEIKRLNDLNQMLEKERNFYFLKCQQIEALCQQDETVDATNKAAVLQILYQTAEEQPVEQAQTEQPQTEQVVDNTGVAASTGDGDLLTSDANAEF